MGFSTPRLFFNRTNGIKKIIENVDDIYFYVWYICTSSVEYFMYKCEITS